MDKSNKEGEKPFLDQKPVKNYLKYSGMAFQMVAYILVGVFIGRKLDQYFATSRPLLTALMAILFLGVYLFKLVRDLSQPD